MRFLVSLAICSPLALVAGQASAQHRPDEGRIACELQLSTCKAAAAPAPSSDLDGSVVVDDGERAWCIPGMPCAKARPASAVSPTQHAVGASPRPAVQVGRRSRLGGATPSFQRATPAPAVGRRIAKSDMQLTFDNNSAALSADAKDRIASYARTLISAPEVVSFRIEGHTNSIGSRASNLDLSRRRAAAVTDYMVSLGVSRDRLSPVGLGFDAPLPGRRAADDGNRRVEIVRK